MVVERRGTRCPEAATGYSEGKICHLISIFYLAFVISFGSAYLYLKARYAGNFTFKILF